MAMDERALSSDLSTQANLVEEPNLMEEQPSLVVEALSISEGTFVWCKFRRYPLWPAVVIQMIPKKKRAKIVFIDGQLFRRKKRGRNNDCTVALTSLRHLNCKEADQFVCAAKQFDPVITWCLEMISDYRLRIAVGSFTRSFLEYFRNHMSITVRNKFPNGAVLNKDFSSDDDEFETEGTDNQPAPLSSERAKQGDSKIKKSDKWALGQPKRRLLPDRAAAAHNRATRKLVDYIVMKRRVEPHLQAVISGQKQSRWMRSFLAGRDLIIDYWVEDNAQMDQLYYYLKKVLDSVPFTHPKLANADMVAFVLDVLLPEAIIHAIAGVDELSLANAERKYLNGRYISNRERQEFDEMISRDMSLPSNRAAFRST